MRSLYSCSKLLLPVISFLFFVGASFAQTLPTPAITGNTFFCTGGSTTLSTAAQTGYTYCWQNTSSSTTWQNVGTSGFTTGRSFHQSLAFNGNTPYVAYQDEANGNKTSVMKFDGSNWVHVGNPGFSSGYSANQNLSFIGNTPYVAFMDWGSNFNGRCTVMKFDGANWINVGNAGFTGGMAGSLKFVINNNTPYVAFQDEVNNYEPTVMKFDGINWVYVGNPGFSIGSVNYMSFAFGGNTPYVAYADASNGSQKTTVMKFDGSNWVYVGIPQFTPGATRNQSLAIDGNTPYVAFVEDALNFKTSVMKFDGANWVYVGNQGLSAGSSSHLSLAINNNTPYIAYQDDANFYKTTVMKFNGAAWVAVGGAGFSSGFANYQSLVFNGNTPYIAFADEPTDYKTTVMKYETGCVGTNNTIQTNTPGTYTVTVTNSSGSSATSIPVTVTEGVIPTVSCSGNLEVCSSEPVFALTGGLPTGGVYSGPGVNNNQFNASSAGTGIKNITYTYTDPSTGCSNSCSFTINVKTAPTVFCNVGTMYVCLNQFPFILANVTPAGGTFSGTGVSDGRFNAAVAGVGDHTITYTVTDPSTGCSSSCSFTIHVWALPVVNCNVGTMYVCQNQAPFALSNVSPAGGTFSGTGVSNGMFNPAVAGVGSHTVTYTVTDSWTFCSNSCSFTIVVRPLPTVTCNNGNMSVCLNQSAFALSSGSPAGGTFSGTGVNNNMFNPATAGLGSHTITYTYTDQTTSCSNSCSFTITVNNSTAPVITPVSNNIVLNLDASGNRTITLADIATVTGGCNSNAAVRFSPNTFNCSSVGSQTITVEATDGIFGPPDPSTVSFNNPIAIASDNAGNFYVADRGSHTIRKISAAGQVTLFAGSTAGYLDGTGTAARFNIIFDIATDAAGNLYVIDAGNRRIRKITSAGAVSTLAGSGSSIAIDGTGTAAGFENPIGITVDNQGNVYVGDFTRVRKITPGGVVTTIAGTTAGFADGTGSAAKFWGLSGLTTDASGNLYIADGANYRVRKMTPAGVVTTIAGGSGQFGYLNGIVIDDAGNMYVCDSDNNIIYKVSSAGAVTFIAGSGAAGTADGTGAVASFNSIFGMTGYNGVLYVADYNNNKIRKVTTAGVVTTFAGSGVLGSTNGNISGITGNYTSLSIEVTIADATAPVITPVSNNIVLNLDASGNRTITAADIVTIIDNCSTPSVRISPSSFNCSTTGLQTVTVEATDGTFGSNHDPSAVSFHWPQGIVVDAFGNIYIVDGGSNTIKKITTAGVMTTFAGSGVAGFADGIGTAASFRDPFQMAIDASGNIYVGDVGNHSIRKITPAGVVTTLAGTGTAGYVDGPASSAKFFQPDAVAVDEAGNVYVIDNGNNCVRKISPAGTVTTFAGQPTPGFVDGMGTAARFNGLSGIATDGAGNVYVSEIGNQRLRKITPAGLVSTLTGDINSENYLLNPYGLAIDQNNNIYVAGDYSQKIYKVTPSGNVTVVAGNGDSGDIDGPGSTARFNGPIAVAFDNAGNLLIADAENHKVKKMTPGYFVTTLAGSGNPVSQNGNIGTTGTGNESSITLQITIKDVTAPVVTPVSTNITLNLDASGNKTITAADIVTVTDNCSAPLVRISPSSFNCSTTGLQTVTVEATDGSFPTLPNPSAVSFTNPQTAVADRFGNVYVAANNQIRKITPDGTVTTLAGSGVAGTTDGVGLNASFDGLRGLAIDADGNIYTAEVWSRKVRKVTPNGTVTTVAGSGATGSTDGPAASASFIWVYSVVLDQQGNIYVADAGSNKIRKISTSGIVSTYAGTGTVGSTDGPANNATFNYVTSLAIDNAGNLYVGEQFKVRKITPAGIVSTFAGSTVSGNVPGIGTNARMARPMGLVFDASGNLFATQEGDGRIIKITSSAEVSTFAGHYGVTTINGTGTAATFRSPEGIGIDESGNLYVADWYLNNIRKITPDATVTTFAGSGQPGSQNGNIGGAGTGNFVSLQIPVTIRDITAPVIVCPADINSAVTSIHPNQTGWATATDNCSATISYTDSNEPSQGCYIIRTWKAVDPSGNSSTCVQRIATPGLTVSLGPDMYIMYGALDYVGCRTITPTITGGIAPYTYSWTSNDPAYPNSSASTLSVCHTSEVTYTYTLTVTAANGCTGTATVQLTFINISCSNNGNNQKVTICHRPEGNPQNCKTICVPVSAVQNFINSGSYYGQCLQGCAIPVQVRTQVNNTVTNEEPTGLFNVKVLGNPSSTHFILLVTGKGNDKIRARVLDALGRLVEVKENIQPGQLFQLGHKYTNGIYMVEVIQGTNSKIVKLIKQ